MCILYTNQRFVYNFLQNNSSKKMCLYYAHRICKYIILWKCEYIVFAHIIHENIIFVYESLISHINMSVRNAHNIICDLI